MSTSELDTRTPYETAPGSMTDLYKSDVCDEQLLADLEDARKNENTHKERADKLESMVEKLELMIKQMAENGETGEKERSSDLLERQNEKLEDKLTKAREQLILERQSARTANLNSWKLEKQLEEVRAEYKIAQRRHELLEQRFKKSGLEHDDTKMKLNQALNEVKTRDDRIQELKEEINSLKCDLEKERLKWQRTEEERMNNKAKVVEQFGNIRNMEVNVHELTTKLQKVQTKHDEMSTDHKHLLIELKNEQDKTKAQKQKISEINATVRQLQRSYEQLKQVCHITDTQLSEVEDLLRKEQKRCIDTESMVTKLEHVVRNRNDTLSELNTKLTTLEQAVKWGKHKVTRQTKQLADAKLENSKFEDQFHAMENKYEQLQAKFFDSQTELDVMTQATEQMSKVNLNRAKELQTIKDENSHLLTQLFYAKETINRLQNEVQHLKQTESEQRADIEELHNVLTEKEQYYLQRDIKAETTLAQQKKLIDYLQIKVEDLTQQNKKKKTFADRLFGVIHSNDKENIIPSAIESSITYRTLEAELQREKQQIKVLNEEINRLSNKNKPPIHIPLKCKNSELNIQETSPCKKNENTNVIDKSLTSPRKKDENTNIIDKSLTSPSKMDEVLNIQAKVSSPSKQDLIAAQNNEYFSPKKLEEMPEVKILEKAKKKDTHKHDFALVISKAKDTKCIVCAKILHFKHFCWRCKECKKGVHKKCRFELDKQHTGNENYLEEDEDEEAAETTEDDTAIEKEELKLKMKQEELCKKVLLQVLSMSKINNADIKKNIVVNCAYEIEELRILLLGCDSGLYALHIGPEPQLVPINMGMKTDVRYMAISQCLAKIIFITTKGESLCQCDFRQLVSRCRSFESQSPLESTVLDLNFANRASTEKWQLIEINNETLNPLDSVAIAATPLRIVILKYDTTQQFRPVRAMDTEAKVISILFTRYTAIVASNRFYELDLKSCKTEDFVDLEDSSMSHTTMAHPMCIIKLSQREYLLCYMEMGIFVDEYGCRSRPTDLDWQFTPTGFIYSEPFLYLTHFQSIQVIRLSRSYTQNVAALQGKDSDDDLNDCESNVITLPIYLMINLPLYMPVILTQSGKKNMYYVVTNKDTDEPCVFHMDGKKCYKLSMNQHDSLESISSIGTSLTYSTIDDSI